MSAIDELRASLTRHPPQRRPLQHATAQFHLGDLLLNAGELEEAEAAYTAAAALFGARGAHSEEGKALNGLGATLRTAGRPHAATRAFEHAAARLAAAGLELDEGAAYFNLGLALREAGEPEASACALERAVTLLDPQRAPAQAAAASRELGSAQLGLGRLDEARVTLEHALELAAHALDEAARSSAANTLGLVHLAAGANDAAATAFTRAVESSPRGARPEGFAIAEANLALARERQGLHARARLAARQALAAPVVPAPVEEHARGVLTRLGTGAEDDVRIVLDEEQPDDARARFAREELVRSADAPEGESAADARAWLRAHVQSRLDPVAVAELWLGALLELPPDALELLVRSAVREVASLEAQQRDEFRAAVVRAMARFHLPQMMRLQEMFTRAAEDAGDSGPWR